MKKLTMLVATAALSLGLNSSSARAQANLQVPRQNFQELIKRFDRDGDGQLARCDDVRDKTPERGCNAGITERHLEDAHRLRRR